MKTIANTLGADSSAGKSIFTSFCLFFLEIIYDMYTKTPASSDLLDNQKVKGKLF